MNIESRHISHGATHNNPDTIVVHAMAEYLADGKGGFIHATEFLDQFGLSAHALISPKGTIFRCRGDNEGAYHARGYNTDSLGIEVLVPGQHNYRSFVEAIKYDGWVSELQYASTVEQCRMWARLHSIERVVMHSELSPERKVDPGEGFPWERFIVDVLIQPTRGVI